MEDKSYSWLLSEFCTSKSMLKILETGICRGSKLLNWFYTDSLGIVAQKPLKENSRTKLLLNYFLNQRLPILEEYNPDKVICYLYHRKGRKVVSAKDAVELAENQLHGLQVRSIHMALNSCGNYHRIYRMHAWSEHGDLQISFSYGKFSKDASEFVKDPVITEKANSLVQYISNILSRTYFKSLKTIKIDLIPDLSGQLHVLKVKELTLSDVVIGPTGSIRSFARSGSMKIIDSSSEEVSLEEINNSNHSPVRVTYDKDQKKKDSNSKIALNKPTPQNSDVFLEMIAKTFDRERKAQENLEMLKEKRTSLEAFNIRKVFQRNSLRSTRENLPKKNKFNTISDLLYYLEKTRPRTWVKDLNGNPLISVKFASALLGQRGGHLLGTPASHKKETSLSSTSSHRNMYKQKLFTFLSAEEQRLLEKRPNRLIAVTPSISVKSSSSKAIGIRYSAQL